MNTVAEAFRVHAPGYLAERHDRLPAAHRRVITSILDCRTDALGTLRFHCTECGVAFDLNRSCGNRHCPSCGKAKGKAWLDRRLDQLLPVPHFMITFTVPAAFRSLFLHHQRLCYGMLFRSSSALLARLGGEQTYFAGDTAGFFGVLHTWGRTLSYHPHIHYIVPAGAFDSRTHRWHPCPTAFYLPVRVLSKLMKARMFARLRRAGLLSEVPPKAFEKDWNVDCRPVGSGVRALRYLSAYVFLKRYQRQADGRGHRAHRHLRLHRHKDGNKQADDPQRSRVPPAVPSARATVWVHENSLLRVPSSMFGDSSQARRRAA